MKKIFENFYIFSKSALSFTLFICLLGSLYLLYTNYNKESLLAQKQLAYEEELRLSINKNLELINKISKEIKLNETTLNEIKENIKSINSIDQNKDFVSINQNIKLLNEKFTIIANEFKILKEDNNTLLNKTNRPEILNKSKNEIIDLILIKFQNNIEFEQELEFLSKLMNKNKTTNFEKLLILSNDPFKGHSYLIDVFNEEVNSHLKDLLDNNPDSFFSKIILPYVSIAPTSENIITNDLILKLKNIKSDIEKKELQSAYNNLALIKNYKKIFELSSFEIEKFLNFKNELYKLK